MWADNIAHWFGSVPSYCVYAVAAAAAAAEAPLVLPEVGVMCWEAVPPAARLACPHTYSHHTNAAQHSTAAQWSAACHI